LKVLHFRSLGGPFAKSLNTLNPSIALPKLTLC